MNEQPPEAARKLCSKSDLTMQEIASWDRHHNQQKWKVSVGTNRVRDT